jgi:hypothetical protein
MKAHSTVPEKGKRLESPKVEPPKQLAGHANEEGSDIDLEKFHQLNAINDILEKLYRTPTPRDYDCEDEANWAYKTASALLTYVQLADVGLDAEGSQLPEPIAQHIVDAIQLQLDIMRLAGKRLFNLCQAKDRKAE